MMSIVEYDYELEMFTSIIIVISVQFNIMIYTNSIYCHNHLQILRDLHSTI